MTKIEERMILCLLKFVVFKMRFQLKLGRERSILYIHHLCKNVFIFTFVVYVLNVIIHTNSHINIGKLSNNR